MRLKLLEHIYGLDAGSLVGWSLVSGNKIQAAALPSHNLQRMQSLSARRVLHSTCQRAWLVFFRATSEPAGIQGETALSATALLAFTGCWFFNIKQQSTGKRLIPLEMVGLATLANATSGNTAIPADFLAQTCRYTHHCMKRSRASVLLIA